MTLAEKFGNYGGGLVQVVRRFPIPVFASVLLCAYQLWHTVNWFDFATLIVKVGSAGFFASGAGHLFAEGRAWQKPANLALALIFGFVAVGLMYFTIATQSASLFFIGGSVLALMIAAHLRHSVNQGALWLFELRFFLAALLAAIAGLVFGLGLSAIVKGLNFLFDTQLSDTSYSNIWVVALTLVGPLYGLTLIPQKLDEVIDIASHKGNLLERGVSVLVNYIMVPLTLIYALILHAYAIKIVILGKLPHGEISTIVSLFAVGGTLTWLLGWPWRETGTKLLRWFMGGWFWLLPVPVLLLVIAIWRRISDYGVTPKRYGIMLLAIWAAFIFAYLLLRKSRADMRLVLGAASALLLLGSFGPQGAFGTTAASQFARLQTLLERDGIQENGKVLAKPPLMVTADQNQAQSMLFALASVDGLPKTAVWFDEPPKLLPDEVDQKWKIVDGVLQKLGGASFASKLNDSFNFVGLGTVDMLWPSKTRLVGPTSLAAFPPMSSPLVPAPNLAVDVVKNDLAVSHDGIVSHIGIGELTQRLYSASQQHTQTRPALEVVLDSHVSLLVTNAIGRSGDAPDLDSMTFWIVQHD